jgi:hypothetical protein
MMRVKEGCSRDVSLNSSGEVIGVFSELGTREASSHPTKAVRRGMRCVRDLCQLAVGDFGNLLVYVEDY